MDNIVRGVLSSMLDGSRTIFLDLLDLRLNLNALHVLGITVLSSSARNFWRKKFSREQIFTSWRWIAKIAKISALRKFPAIRYMYSYLYICGACISPSPILPSPNLNRTGCTTALNAVTWLKYATEQCWISTCDCYTEIHAFTHIITC